MPGGCGCPPGKHLQCPRELPRREMGQDRRCLRLCRGFRQFILCGDRGLHPLHWRCPIRASGRRRTQHCPGLFPRTRRRVVCHAGIVRYGIRPFQPLLWLSRHFKQLGAGRCRIADRLRLRRIPPPDAAGRVLPRRGTGLRNAGSRKAHAIQRAAQPRNRRDRCRGLLRRGCRLAGTVREKGLRCRLENEPENHFSSLGKR